MADKKSTVKETSALVWEDPPAQRGGRATSQAHAEIAAALKSRPGEWAKVATGVGNDGLASSIRRSTGANFRDGVYEARSTKTGEGTFDIYARYVEPRK